MEPWQYIAAAAVIGWLLLKIRSAVIKTRNRRQRDFDRKLETVLQPKETVKMVCPQKGGRCILTSKRLLFETREGFTAVPLTKIKKVQGTNEAGNRTTSVPKMVSLTVKADKDYIIRNTGEEFAELAKILVDKMKQKEKKKKEKEKAKAAREGNA